MIISRLFIIGFLLSFCEVSTHFGAKLLNGVITRFDPIVGTILAPKPLRSKRSLPHANDSYSLLTRWSIDLSAPRQCETLTSAKTWCMRAPVRSLVKWIFLRLALRQLYSADTRFVKCISLTLNLSKLKQT